MAIASEISPRKAAIDSAFVFEMISAAAISFDITAEGERRLRIY